MEKPFFEEAGVAGIGHCMFISQPEAEANTASKRKPVRAHVLARDKFQVSVISAAGGRRSLAESDPLGCAI